MGNQVKICWFKNIKKNISDWKGHVKKVLGRKIEIEMVMSHWTQ